MLCFLDNSGLYLFIFFNQNFQHKECIISKLLSASEKKPCALCGKNIEPAEMVPTG